MPFEIRSLIDRRLVLISVLGIVTLPQIRSGGLQVDMLVSAGEAPVHVITDVSQMTGYPLSPSQIFQAAPYLRHPNLGYVPSLGVTNLLLKTMLRVVGQMAPFKYQVVQSLPEALAFLSSHDSRIDANAIAEALRHSVEPPASTATSAAP